jgi:cytoskeletal protein CcmA (bactofilin family)
LKKNGGQEGRTHRGTMDCVVGLGVKVEGRLSCDGFLRVEGECRGSLESAGGIIIAEAAKVEADIRGKDILVAGRVTGTIEAEGLVRLAPEARVKGNIMTKRFSMEEGALFSGKVGRSAE